MEAWNLKAWNLKAYLLLRGTLYRKCIESISRKGPLATIKTNRNVGGLPDIMKLKLFDPFRLLFKDEVQKLGLVLGVEEERVYKHLFPGLRLAIRILGYVRNKRLEALRETGDIFQYELHTAELYRDITQAFAVSLPVKSVGVMADTRTYEELITLRAVKSNDYMTTELYNRPVTVLRRASCRKF